MKNIETEIKLIIKRPDDKWLCERPDYTESEIFQIYIGSGDSTHRVRRRSYSDGRVEYTENKKTRISPISSIEEEREISAEEFNRLAENIENGTIPITKRRKTFSHLGRTVEIDIYPQWKNSCILEIELSSEDEKAPLPEEITVLRDVSSERCYSNHAMARSFPKEIE